MAVTEGTSFFRVFVQQGKNKNAFHIKSALFCLWDVGVKATIIFLSYVINA